MHVLWAPWRMAYVGAAKAPGCLFCTVRDRVAARADLVLLQEPALVMLNKFPYANGHLLVAPRRHAARLDDLPAEEFQTLTQALRHAAGVLAEALRPEGVNIGMNLGAAAGAGIADHLHWHLVPRWVGDTNFMPLLAEVRVIPEHLEAMYDRLQPLFAAPRR